MIRGLCSLSWNWFLAAYVALIAVLLFAVTAHAAASTPVFTVPSVSCPENAGSCQLVINKNARASSYSKLRIETVDGTAKAGADYSAVNTVVTIGNTALKATVAVPIVDNKLYQPSRVLGIRITALRNAIIASGYEPTTVTITEDDAPLIVPAPTGLAGEADVADNFDLTPWLEPGEPPGTNPDQVGAFRFTCLAGQLLKDDPIVYPGQPGKSHLHQFFGNTGTNASSDYQSLRTTGGSTCTRSADVSPQRSAYWMPAMLDGAGNAVKADWVKTYYKRLPASDPGCANTADPSNGDLAGPPIGKCVGLPNGVRFVLGYNMATMSGGPADLNSRDYWSMVYDCVAKDGNDTSYLPRFMHTIKEVVDSGLCPAGAWLRVAATFPNCWDGHNLDVADHRSNVVYGQHKGCPSDHPYIIPEIALGAYFTTDANFAAGKWHLSSDEMMPGTVPGTTLHVDYWEAWSRTLKDLWNANCLDGHLTCSSGNVGDGRQIRGMQIDFAPIPNHVLVPLSSIP